MGGLRRDIGFVGAAFIVLNAVVGAGIFALPGKVGVVAGAMSPWLFLIIGALFISVILAFAELASYYRDTGGPLLYATDAFGPLAGFGTGWSIFISRMTASAANANVMATYLGALHASLATDLVRNGIITVLFIGLAWANVRGTRDGVRTLSVFTILKVVPLLLLILLGLQHVSGATLLPGGDYAWDRLTESLGSTTLMLIYAYVGFETIGVTAGETASPRRNLPRALVSALLATAVFYFLIVMVFVAVIPETQYATATLVDVGRSLMGPVGALIITATAAFSIGGNIAGSVLGAPRLLFAMSRSRMLPAWFGRIHEKYQTPDRAIITMCAMCLALALTGSFVFLAVASTVVRLLGYMICIASIPKIRQQADDEARAKAYRAPGGYAVPAFAFAVCVYMLYYASMESWIAVGALLAIGFTLYALEKTFARKHND